MWPFRRREERSLPFGAFVGPSGTLPTWAGATVDTDTAMRLSAVWACVRLLGDTVSTLPVDVYRRGERAPIATPPVLVEPAAGIPAHEFLYSTMTSLLLRGNAYGLITARSGATLLPAQLELVHPDKVSVTVDPDGRVAYRLLGREVDRADVWHVRAFTMPGAVVGLSPVEYARQSIGLGLAAEKFGAQFFGDNATPSGLLTTPERLHQSDADRLALQWKAAHQGSRNPAVLSGDLKFTPISVSPDDSQFVETAQLNVAQVARVFGVPPEMVGAASSGSNVTYANVEARALDFLRYSVSPWLVRLESALGRLLPAKQFVRFNTGGLLRADTRSRYEAHKVALDAGFLTVDEVRELEDRPPFAPAAAGGPQLDNETGVA